jgi:hypothetical protein
MDNEILLFAEKITPRLTYTVGSIVGNLLSVSFVFTEDKALFMSSNLPKINYSNAPISDNEVIIEPQNLLFETTIKAYLIESENDFFMNKINTENSESIDFELNLNVNNQVNLGNNLNTNYAFNFDIFSRIFYLITRYEEYKRDPSVYDAFGRFPSTKSVASKLNFLQQPVVNQYIIALSEKLKSRFPNLKMDFPTYRFQPSFDFDMAWLYRNKGFLRNAGGLLKDVFKGQFNAVKKRFNILIGTEKDPYFNFQFIKELHLKYGLNLIVFWLLGDLAKYDKNIAWTHPEFQSLIQSFAADFRVGIHPSYRSNASVSILQKEVNRLATILNFTKVQNSKNMRKSPKNAFYTEGSSFPSRQHFLKLTFPETYRRLLSVGIREDWTMGYADETGFRAGMATPFPWFDLEKNEETALIIHPFQAMDVTLKNYLNLSPEAATERLRDLIAATRAVGGTFTSLWHNDNLAEMDDWKGWRVVYERLLEDAKDPSV